MTKPKEKKIKEKWEIREEFTEKLHKHVHFLGNTNIIECETEKFWSWFDQKLKEQRTQLLKEIKEKVEGMKKNRTFMDEDCEWCGKKFCESCKGRNVHNKALSDVLELLTK